MSNSLLKDLEIVFENFIEGFDAACVISMEAEKSNPDPAAMQRAGDVFYRRQDFHASVVTGLDLSLATSTDVIDRLVSTTYRSPDNVLWTLDAKEMRDPAYKERMGKAAATRLAAEVDSNLYTQVVSRAGIVIKKTGALDWATCAAAEAQLLMRGCTADQDRKIFMNPTDYLAISGELAGKAYMGDVSMSAYERSKVPDIAGFRSFRTDNMKTVTVTGTVSGTTINGNQSHTVTAMTGDVPTDNRQMTLTVQGTNVANIKAGDCFTIAGVNAVHQIDKSDTGSLQTFRVLATASAGTSLTITPAIVSSGPYQNCSAQAANNAALVWLNTATKPANVFWAKDAVFLDYGNLAFPTGEGAQVLKGTTKQGVPLVMSYQFSNLTGKTTCRFTTLYATTVTQPEKCGIILANQS